MITPPTYKEQWGDPNYQKVDVVGDQIEDAAKQRSRLHVQQRITGLCGSCSNSMIYQTRRDNEPTILCTSLSPEQRMPVDIEFCTRYSAVGQLDIATLARMATLIDPDSKETAGFKVQIVGKE